MATYTVYVPSGFGDLRQRADRTIFIREGFSWAAFVFGPLYLLYRRLWLAAVAWIVIAAGFWFLVHALGLPPTYDTALTVLLSLLTGFEARTLRQVALRRRRYDFAALLTAPSLAQAERVFFTGEGARDASRTQAAVPVRRENAAMRPPDVIGLFPRAGEA